KDTLRLIRLRSEGRDVECISDLSCGEKVSRDWRISVPHTVLHLRSQEFEAEDQRPVFATDLRNCYRCRAQSNLGCSTSAPLKRRMIYYLSWPVDNSPAHCASGSGTPADARQLRRFHKSGKRSATILINTFALARIY